MLTFFSLNICFKKTVTIHSTVDCHSFFETDVKWKKCEHTGEAIFDILWYKAMLKVWRKFWEPFKGQLISKANCQAVNSSKKRTKEFVFTTMRHVFVHFLEGINDTKKTFRNYLTISIYQLISTANPAQFHKLWLNWLCYLVGRP